MKYILITLNKETNNEIFFQNFFSEFKQFSSPDIGKRKEIQLRLVPHSTQSSFNTLEEARKELQSDKIQFILEYAPSKNNLVTAMYDSYFTQIEQNHFYRIDLNYLFLHEGKYTNGFSSDRLMSSVCYGMLKELCMHNSANKEVYHRSVSMLDSLYKNPPSELYKITQKTYSINATQKLLEKSLGTDTQWIKIISQVLNHKPAIPQINMDHFDLAEMRYALENVGTFELVGNCVNNLKKAGENALSLCNDILSLPKTVLNKVAMQEFNGFQNVRKDTKEKFKKTGAGLIRNQIAFHCKPYLGAKEPGNLSLKVYVDYYDQGLALLHTLYRYIAISYKIHPDALINYLNDKKSVLTTRKYFPKKEGETGIPPHSDYGLLTLVVSDEKGLEVEKDGKWYSAPHTPGLRFFVNFGDWFGFQLRNLGVNCKMGIHRVPEVDKVRHSLALFLNPPKDQIVKVPNGQEITYETYLTSAKVPYNIAK